MATILIISSIVKRLLWRASPLARGPDFIQGGARPLCPPLAPALPRYTAFGTDCRPTYRLTKFLREFAPKIEGRRRTSVGIINYAAFVACICKHKGCRTNAAKAQLFAFCVYSSGLCTWNLMISEWHLLCSSVPWSVGSCDRFFAHCWQAAFSWYNADCHSTKAIQHRWWNACISLWLITFDVLVHVHVNLLYVLR